jgi:hypothetical protein
VNRTAARIVALASTAAAVMTLAAGTASAGGYGDDQRCEKPKGVVVVCTSDQLVDLSDLDADVLNILDGHGHHR